METPQLKLPLLQKRNEERQRIHNPFSLRLLILKKQ